MIKEAMEYLLGKAQTFRPPWLQSGDKSGRMWIFSDKIGEYIPVERYVDRERSVSNIESFAAMVIEEVRRAGVDEPSDGSVSRSKGDRATVIFKPTGAEFHLDDRDGRTAFKYVRELSAQWKALLAASAPRDHLDFIRQLQRLRPSIPDYLKTITEFRKVSFSKRSSVDSAPTLVNGKSGLVHELEYTAKGGYGPTKAALPSTIEFNLPYTQGSSKRYESAVEVAVELNEDDRRIEFSLVFADSHALAEQAIADEVAWFRDQVKELSLLSILEDY